MGQITELSVRLQVIAERQKGQSYRSICALTGLSYNTVRALCHRHTAEGEAGLVPRTARCGRRVKLPDEICFRLVRLVSYAHPNWGVPYIVVLLRRRHPGLSFQSVRHYQRRLGAGAPRKLPPAVVPREQAGDRARLPHDVWQIDAKERIAFDPSPSGEVCFLNVTDEKTSALLCAAAFPPGAHLPSKAYGGAGSAAAAVRAVGAAHRGAYRQWRTFRGAASRCHSRTVPVAGCLGHQAHFKPAPCAPGQRQGGAKPGYRGTVARNVALQRHGRSPVST